MSKRILSLLMALAVVMSLSAVAAAVETETQPEQTTQTEALPAETVPEQDAQSEVEAEAAAEAETEVEVETQPEAEEEPLPPADFYVNDQPVYNAPLYWLNDVPYAPVRPFFASALPGCEIKWEDRQAVITGTTAAGETLSVAARPGACYLQANGRYLYAPDNIQLINSTTMIPLPLLAQLFNGSVTVDEGGAVRVSLGGQVLAAANYDPAQIDLFSRLIFSESGNQSMLGQLAVGNVVINRMNSPLFPSTLYDVIHQKNQFSVVGDGNIHLTPDDEAVIAAKLCLEGAKVTDALFFNVKGLKCWAFYARPFIATIGDHDFYA